MVGDESGHAAKGVIRPLSANAYLHYVFDLRLQARRKKSADGEAILVRRADDFELGFEHRTEAAGRSYSCRRAAIGSTLLARRAGG